MSTSVYVIFLGSGVACCSWPSLADTFLILLGRPMAPSSSELPSDAAFSCFATAFVDFRR
eukprot:253914-Pyramimonas_sp.AAC.1